MSNPVEANVAAAIEKLSYIPKYAKLMLTKAASGESADIGNLPISAFADGAGREYPCHSKEAVFASAVKYTLAPGGRKNVLDEIMKAARVFNVDDDVLFAIDDIRQRQHQQKSAGSPTVYALPTEQYFPISTKEELAESMVDFRKAAHLLPFRMRFIAANNMAKAAEFHLVDATDYVKAASGAAVKSSADISAGLYDRVSPDHRNREVYVKAANAVAETKKMAREYALKLCAALDVMDKAAGIHDNYSSVPTPEEIVFGAKAKPRALVKLANGFTVDLLKIKSSSLRIDDLAELGSGFIDAVAEDPFVAMGVPKEAGITGDPNINYTKLANMLPTLNVGDSNMFMSILRKKSK